MAVTQPSYDFPRPSVHTVKNINGQPVKTVDADSFMRVLLRMQQDLNTLSGRTNQNKAQGPQDMAGYAIQNAVNSASPTSGEVVTYGLLQSVSSPKAIAKSISFLGQDPTARLNVQGLHGLLADPQTPIVADPPVGLPNPQTTPEGQLSRVGSQVYILFEGNWEPLGGLPINLVTVDSTYNAADTDHSIVCTSGSFTVTLPTTDLDVDQDFRVKNMGSGLITVSAGGTLIDKYTSYLLGPWNASATFTWSGSQFFVFGGQDSL